jgi:hypothetical protein
MVWLRAVEGSFVPRRPYLSIVTNPSPVLNARPDPMSRPVRVSVRAYWPAQLAVNVLRPFQACVDIGLPAAALSICVVGVALCGETGRVEASHRMGAGAGVSWPAQAPRTSPARPSVIRQLNERSDMGGNCISNDLLNRSQLIMAGPQFDRSFMLLLVGFYSRYSTARPNQAFPTPLLMLPPPA